jgi:hypothetical protein
MLILLKKLNFNNTVYIYTDLYIDIYMYVYAYIYIVLKYTYIYTYLLYVLNIFICSKIYIF